MAAQCGDTVFTSSAVINSFPYLEDFENGKKGWFHRKIQGNFPNPAGLPSTQVSYFPGVVVQDSWAFGTPTKTRIAGAHSGDSAWVTGGLSGNYPNQEHSYVMSPPFDFSSLDHPVIGLWINHDTELNVDGACMQSSVDSGKTWTRLGSANNNWYNMRQAFSSPGRICSPANPYAWGGWSRGWKWVQHDLKHLAGKSSVVFRLVFASDFLQTIPNQGFAFDDVAIVEKPSKDLGQDTVLCLGDQKVFNLGAVPHGSYSWQNSTIAPYNSQTYTVVTNPSGLTQSIKGCVTDTLLGFEFCDTVLVHSSLLIPPNITDSTFCEGDSIKYDLRNPGAMWSWHAYDSASLNFGFLHGMRTLVTDTSAVYIYAVFDNLGCRFSDTIEARLEKTPPIDLGLGDTVCIGQSRIFTAPNGPPGTSYEWRLNSLSTPFAYTQTIFASAPGKYTVTLITPAQCKEKDSVSFGVVLAPVVDLGPDIQSCYALTLDANNAGSQFIWSTGATSQSLQVTPPFTGWVEVTNYLGCSARDSIVITEGTPPLVDLGGDQVLCDQSSILLDPGPQAMGSIILWCTGLFQQSLQVVKPGQYCVKVTDTNGCIGTDTVKITRSGLKVDLGPDGFICDGKSLLLDAESPGATYSWNTGAQTPSIRVTSAGVYGVVLTDALGCVKSDSITVHLLPAYEAAIGISPAWAVAFGKPITFNSTQNPAGTQSWKWDLGNGVKANGQTVTYTYPSVDTFTVCLIMSDGVCSDTVCEQAGNFLDFTGMEEKLGMSLGVYPNPSDGIFHFAAQLHSPSRLHIGIWDMEGKQIIGKAFEKSSNFHGSLDLTALPAGLYFMKIQSEKGSTFRKIMKQ